MNAAEVLEMARRPHAWTPYVTGDPSPARLEAILRVLGAQPDDDVAAARAAHVLMLLGRPGEAAHALLGRLHRLCRAQRLLALVQVARDTRNLRLYVEVVAHQTHFGLALTALELEAQMRLDYALGLAHGALGSDGSARLHLAHALHVSLMIGVQGLEAGIAGAMSRRESQQDPRGHARRLALLAGDVQRENMVMARHLARESRDLLAGMNDYAGLISTAEGWASWHEDAAGWASAARTMLDPAHEPPPAGDGRDPLLLLARAFHHVHLAARADDRLDHGEAREQALCALRLAGWPSSGPERGTPEVAYRTLRIAAHLLAGQHREATLAVRDAVTEGLMDVSDTAAWYMGVAGLSLAAHGAATPAEWSAMRAYTSALAAIERMEHGLAALVATRAAHVSPDAALLLSRAPSAPSALTGVASRLAVLHRDGRVVRAGRKLRKAPGDAGLIAAITRAGRKLDARERVVKTRYGTALLEAGSPPVASEDRLARIEAELHRHMPTALPPRPAA